MNRKNIFIALLVILVIGIGGYFAFVKNQTSTPQTQQTVFASQEECEQKTGKSCSFQMCDYVPPGKTFAEVCGKDFKKGWVPKSAADDISQPETNQWKTYTNTEYKYRVNYPPDWETANVTVQPSPAAVKFTKITKQDGKYINDAVVDIIVEPNPLRQTPTEEWYREWVKQIPAGINLEGVKIEETTFKNMKAIKIDNSTIFFAKGFNIFRIKWHVAGDYNQSLVESTEKIFEQMLDTFAFFD